MLSTSNRRVGFPQQEDAASAADHMMRSNISAIPSGLDINLSEVLDMAGSLSDQDLPNRISSNLSESDRITSDWFG